MSPRSYTDDQVEFIRAKAPDHSDPEVAALMNWPTWKVLHVRTRHQIPAMPKDAFWTEERMGVVRLRFIEQGESSEVVGKALGCQGSTVRRLATRQGWCRQAGAPDNRKRNAPAPAAAPKPPARRPIAKTIHRAPVNFSEAPRPVAALSDRIAANLARRPMSAPTLAVLLGVKELAVSVQLAAMADAGQVVAGPAAEVGIRHRVWKRAA